MKSYTSHSLDETHDIAGQWLTDISAKYGERDEALVVGLSGHLGAGKTAFVKAVAKHLGISGDVTSPTFVIMKLYDISQGQWKRLVHIDAYRLERREELEVLKWEQLIADRHNLILIEWPENVGLKEFVLHAQLSFEIKEGVHRISVQ
ncbi:MAG: tRNA (adenosine(37)-N6)-threonylcarbamoyltransferase complex ATPase subunit type 1 TsaE [Patescibacteria group bacterium]